MNTTSSGYPFTSESGYKYILRFICNNSRCKYLIDVMMPYSDEQNNLLDFTVTLEFSKDEIHQVLIENTYIADDARKYYMRIIRNSVFI